MISFKEKIKRIKGITINLPEGAKGQILETYKDGKALVRIFEGCTYTVTANHFNLEIESTGKDTRLYSLDELEALN